jgi:hypothetical protein
MVVTVTAVVAVAAAAAASAAPALDPGRDDLAPGALRTGILYDRVAPLSQIERHDGSAAARPATRAVWSQIHFELTRAALTPPAWPALDAVLASARRASASGVVPVAILDFEYERLRDPRSTPHPVTAADLVVRRAFAAAALRATTYRGAACTFAFEAAWYASNRPRGLRTLAVDLDDGRGWRAVRWGDRPVAAYDRVGRRHVRLRAVDAAGRTLLASFPLEVARLGTPAPDDTLDVVASIPYQGSAGTGRAYVYRAPANATLAKPIVVVEGFDLDNTIGWDELYAALSQENLIETLRDQGFDAVVLDFTNATDPIQRNAFVVTELLSQVQAAIPPAADIVVVGASMGGLVGRYALAYLESQAMPPRVRTFISFDAPQRGANIPLGVQYWVQFFADLSVAAAEQRDLLNTPAARQMLVYHFTDPPSAAPSADPLRTQLVADLAAVGEYPHQPRLVAIANGSGAGVGQGFQAAEQVLRYEHTSFTVDITGNIWAVPAGGSAMIFRGIIDYFFPPPDVEQTVTVSGTAPYDNAPGGWRGTMADMDSIAAPFGDIEALHPDHCFIPTTSALDFETQDLSHDIAADPDPLAHTPFDAIYFPAANQEHVHIDAATAAWLLAEIPPAPSSVPAPAAPPALVLFPNVPNPFNPSTRMMFDVPRASAVEIAIHDVGGRRITTLLRDQREPGRYDVTWNGTTSAGTPAPSGVYVCTLRSIDGSASRRLVLVR